MEIKATKIKAKDLKEGDMFSTANQFYWDNRDKFAIGEKIYIRTECPCSENQKEDEVYKILINLT